MKKEKKNKLSFKHRMFNKLLEKPINNILIVTYELYELSCKVYLDADQIPTYEEYCQSVHEKLKSDLGGV